MFTLLNIMNQLSLLKRTTLKLSKDLSEEEIRKAISESIGIPIEQVPRNDFEDEKRKLTDQRNKLEKIIADYKDKLEGDTSITQDKYEELYDVGRFILFTNEEIRIHIPDEILKFPDFILLLQDQQIGLEHTRLINKEIKAIFETAKYYIKKAEELIADELNHHSKTINIFIDYNENVIDKSNFKNRQFSPEQRKNVSKAIANFIKSTLTGGNIPKPNFISQIEITPNNDLRVDLELAETYFSLSEFTELLIQRIKAKERKASKYRIAGNVTELWLLIIIDEINSFSGFDLLTAKFPEILDSNFNKIFMLEKFGGKIYHLFQKD